MKSFINKETGAVLTPACADVEALFLKDDRLKEYKPKKTKEEKTGEEVTDEGKADSEVE
ncbi:MAG: hypothetical protein RR198_05140 [Oscillospiraceae bacterium]